MKSTDAENTIKKLKYPKHLRHLSIERLLTQEELKELSKILDKI